MNKGSTRPRLGGAAGEIGREIDRQNEALGEIQARLDEIMATRGGVAPRDTETAGADRGDRRALGAFGLLISTIGPT